jgi:phosphoglycolate phosphatase
LAQPLAGCTIVFDLDGTLVDTAPDLIGTLNQVLTEQCLPVLPLDRCRNLIGAGARALIARGFAEAGAPDLDEARMNRLFDRFIDLYLARIADESRPFPGVLDALDALSGDGAVLAVCTNKRTSLSLALLDALGLTGRFAAVIGPDAAPAQKPDPRHLFTAIDLAGGRRDRAVMVGDSVSDARAAQSGQVPLVLVSFGYTDTPAADLGADVLIDHFDALPAACARLLRVGLSAPA